MDELRGIEIDVEIVESVVGIVVEIAVEIAEKIVVEKKEIEFENTETSDEKSKEFPLESPCCCEEREVGRICEEESGVSGRVRTSLVVGSVIEVQFNVPLNE